MEKRGRKSVADLASFMPEATAMYRPEPSYELYDEQAGVWRSSVSIMPADWFKPESHPCLVALCRHIIAARKLAQLIRQVEKAKRLDAELYIKLLARQEAEGRAISSLSTRLRLTPQSQYKAERAAHPRRALSYYDKMSLADGQ